MGQRGYIGAITAPPTPDVSASIETVSTVSPRHRLEGDNSIVKPIVSVPTSVNTSTRATYIGQVQTSAPLTTLTVSLSTESNPVDLRWRLRGDNSIVKPVVTDHVVAGIPKTRLYLGSMTSSSTVVLLNSLTVTPTVTSSKLRAFLKGDNSTIKPAAVHSTSTSNTHRGYIGAMETSAPLTTIIEPIIQSILDVEVTHSRLTGENSTVKPLVIEDMATEGPIDRRIYIGGDFFSGNLSGGFIEWDPTTLTLLALKDCRRFWGVNTATSITGAEMQSLSGNAKVHADTHQITYSITGGYLYYAHPQPLGSPTIYVNGFMNTAWITSTVTVLENGIYVTYVIYRSVYKQNGNNINLKIDLPL